ncbi:helix-turn-helix transcriptional regulator [Eubacterium sp.]|uniref:helix-turn-helix transcriptional regulator n=1 Tax=Eubacterium sp. TaxID=142586 RepID=UPI0026DD8E6F|nr:helix-turn-helix transcriptional regulator [uncultured Eubacterium sp.]
MTKDIQISLAAARVNAGLTQDEVARKLKVTKQTIVNWEKGRKELKPAEFYMLSEIYKIPKNNIFLPKI